METNENKESDLGILVSKALNRPRGDHAIAIFKAGLAAFPIVGGSVASLIGDYVPTSTSLALERAVASLGQALIRLEDRLDFDTVDRDEFADLFKTSYLAIVRSSRKEKIDAATNILVNLLLRKGEAKKIEYSELDHFARAIESLSPGAILALGHIYDVATADHDENHRRKLPLRCCLDREMQPEDAGVADPQLLLGLIVELQNWGLVWCQYFSEKPEMSGGQLGTVYLLPLGLRLVDSVLRLS